MPENLVSFGFTPRVVHLMALIWFYDLCGLLHIRPENCIVCLFFRSELCVRGRGFLLHLFYAFYDFVLLPLLLLLLLFFACLIFLLRRPPRSHHF